MIQSIDIKDPSKCCLPWWSTVPWLKKRTTLPFTPGVNILFGPNGSGKSTVLRLIARMLHCEQGGVQKVTWSSKNNLLGQGSHSHQDGVLPIHDGSPIIYFDPSQTAGLIGGGFDDDFFREGLQNTMFKGSAGQTTLMRAGTWMHASMENKWPQVPEWKNVEEDHKWMQDILKASIPADRPTLLLDEPSKSLDIKSEVIFWINTVYLAKRQKVQIIAATHSPFALGLPGVNYIETEIRYLKRTQNIIAGRGKLLEVVEKEIPLIVEGCGIGDVK